MSLRLEVLETFFSRTGDGLAELAKTPEFAAWVAANHQNIRFGPPEGDDDL